MHVAGWFSIEGQYNYESPLQKGFYQEIQMPCLAQGNPAKHQD